MAVCHQFILFFMWQTGIFIWDGHQRYSSSLPSCENGKGIFEIFSFSTRQSNKIGTNFIVYDSCVQRDGTSFSGLTSTCQIELRQIFAICLVSADLSPLPPPPPNHQLIIFWTSSLDPFTLFIIQFKMLSNTVTKVASSAVKAGARWVSPIVWCGCWWSYMEYVQWFGGCGLV